MRRLVIPLLLAVSSLAVAEPVNLLTSAPTTVAVSSVVANRSFKLPIWSMAISVIAAHCR